MWDIQYSEFYINKSDDKPIEVDLKIKIKKFSIKFTLTFERFHLFVKDGYMYYDDGIYDITIDKKKDCVSIGINNDHSIGYLIYNYKGGKELYEKCKNIYEGRDVLECSKRLIF